MPEQSVENVYLQQVLEEQEKVGRELRTAPAKRRGPSLPGAPAPKMDKGNGDDEAAGRAIDYRITGFGRWRNVIVPPNVYVVHTRRGHEDPIHIGLGISFRFNPITDSFLVIPSAMQTIIINANCICTERQGILVQAYVQWIIDDIAVAYKKLDFSDPDDPMRVVNVQLREQAEAALKDKVATMSIDEVLSDKEPIIEELTHRLRMVAEGNREEDSSGLGLKIVTVQIKEAVVSSARVWQNLQVPFRAEREKIARLAELKSQKEIAARQLDNRLAQERGELKAKDEIDQLRSEKDQAQYDREHAESVRRHQLEQEAKQQAITEENLTEKARMHAAHELALRELELQMQQMQEKISHVRAQMELDQAQAEQKKTHTAATLEIQEMRHLAETTQSERELALFGMRREIENDLSERHLQAQLVAILPELASQMPAPEEMRTTIISSDEKDGSLSPLLRFLASVMSLIERPARRTEEPVEPTE
jgi:hypothetical protein